MDYKLSEAAIRIGVTATYLRRLIQDGKLEATRHPDGKGPYWTISDAEVERLIAKRKERAA